MAANGLLKFVTKNKDMLKGLALKDLEWGGRKMASSALGKAGKLIEKHKGKAATAAAGAAAYAGEKVGHMSDEDDEDDQKARDSGRSKQANPNPTKKKKRPYLDE